MDAVDLTYKENFFAILNAPMAAEVRTDTDLAARSAALEHFLKSVLARQQPVQSKSRIDAPQAREDAENENPPLATMGPWLVDTMKVIDTHRKVLSQLNAKSRDSRRRMLETAEMLAFFLADISPRRRPQIHIDDEGHPGFASALADFYFHLTVDAPGLVTWYAKVNGVEHFHEGVAFEGRSFPPQLKQLFAA
jgi:hypothetical protein